MVLFQIAYKDRIRCTVILLCYVFLTPFWRIINMTRLAVYNDNI